MFLNLGGHVYHYECIQRMYNFDRENGKKSCCAICRQTIISVPNKIFGNFPHDPISYTICESIGPNITGKRGGRDGAQGQANSRNNELLLEQLEFYEGRLADLEAQVDEFDGIEDQISRLESQILVKTNENYELKRKLDERNMEMIQKIKRIGKIEGELAVANRSINSLECQNSALKVELSAAKTELIGYQDSKLSLETERLASEITHLQRESYFKNLQKYHTQTEIVGLLAGMHVKFNDSENARTELEKENRRLKVEIERMARKPKLVVNNVVELELGNENFHNPQQAPIQVPELFERSPPPQHLPAALNVSKLVPTIRPKGLAFPRGTITTGTGKRSKIMEMPDGTKRIV